MNKRTSLFSVALIMVMALAALTAGQVSKVQAQAATPTATALATSTATLVPVLPVTGGQAAQASHQELLASNIIGRMAYLQDGTQLGPVASLIVNSQTGEVQYAVILLGNQARNQMNSQLGVQPGAQLDNQNAQGQGAKYVPVPWQLLSVLPQIEAQQLQNNNAPLNNSNNMVPTLPGSTALPTQQSTSSLNMLPTQQSTSSLNMLPTQSGVNSSNPLLVGTPNAPAFSTPMATQSGTLLITPGISNENETETAGIVNEQENRESDLSQQAQNTLVPSMNTPMPQFNATATPIVGQPVPSTGSYYLQQFDAVVVQSSLDNINSAPSFSNNEVRNWQGQNWGQSIASYWNSQVASLPQTGAQLQTDHLIEFQNLQGIDVVNASSNSIGYVENMVIDQSSGKVSYVLVRANGGQLNTSAKLVPVPFSQLQWMQNDFLPEFQLSANALDLNNAPIISSNSELNSLSGNSSFQQGIDNYWNGLSGAAANATPGVSIATGTVSPTESGAAGGGFFNFGTTTPTP